MPVNKEQQQPTIALIVRMNHGQPVLEETLTSLEEMLELELALLSEDDDPLGRVRYLRSKGKVEEEEFADFVENLLSQPFVKPDVQTHAVQWFKSRSKIETYQKAEDEAAKVIAQYAFQVFSKDPSKIDFVLSGPRAKVRIRVIQLPEEAQRHVA